MLDPSTMSMADILRLQAQLQHELAHRFQRQMALVFTDIVGSTAYFKRFGDATGRLLQQLHLDLLGPAVLASAGRIVDTAGDGAFCVFDSADDAAQALLVLQHGLSVANGQRAREHQLTLRVGLHWGPVLTDGHSVSGDAVNTCARVAASADPGELRLTQPAAQALAVRHQAGCRQLGEVALKGIAQPLSLLSLDGRDPHRFPRQLQVEETGQLLRLPGLDLVVVGRFAEREAWPSNDLVLNHPDPRQTRLMSRAHFELRRTPDGLLLGALSSQPTEVDGRALAPGEQVPVAAGARIGLAGVLTLQLQALAPPDASMGPSDADATMMAAVATRSGVRPLRG
jgi:class 3 adenylate cyclase